MEEKGTKPERLSGVKLTQAIVEQMFRELHSPKDVEAYRAEKMAQIERYQPTWMVRNFQAEQGRVYDFYNRRVLRAYIEEDPSLGCVAYISRDGQPQPLDREPVTLGKAIIDIEALEGDL